MLEGVCLVVNKGCWLAIASCQMMTAEQADRRSDARFV